MKKISLIILFIISFFEIVYAQNNGYRHSHINSAFAKTYDPRSDSVDILNYTINLDIIDITGKKISGNTSVKFHPKVNGINYLRLDLLKLNIDSIILGSERIAYHYNDTLISINLQKSYSTSDTINLTVYYKGSPQTDATGWGGFYFQNGFAYNLGVGFGANPHVYGRVWFPCFDNFTERSTYEFNIKTISSKYSYCNGELISDVLDSQNYRTRKWVLNNQIPSYLASVAVGNFVDLKMNYSGEQKNIPILIASIASDTIKVKSSLVHLKDAIRTYEKFYGPYAWNKVGYSLVPFSQGAMEHATNIAFPASFLNSGVTTYEEITAHELSHHWFGDYITCSSQEEMWINEGWASFSEYLFREEVYGRAAYISGIKILHESLLHFVRYKEGDLNLNNIPHQYTYGDHVYLKGAIMAHNLRGYLGDSLFKSTIRKTLSDNAYKSISNEQFEQSLSANSGIDLSDYFKDWIYQPGWAHFSTDSIVYHNNTAPFQVSAYINQTKYGNTNLYHNVPMEISFIDRNFNAITKRINLDGAQSFVNIEIPFKPALTILNMNDKIAQAISSEQKIIKTTGANNFVLGKMNLNISEISDSALLRVEHHYAGATGQTSANINRISPQRYWTVKGILPNKFKASAKINYDGRIGVFSGNAYLDHQLNIVNEDSLILLYRRDASEIWKEYPYYTKNTLSSKTDKLGNMNIDSLILGEYSYGIGKSLKTGSTFEHKKSKNGFEIYPNPANKQIELKLNNIEKSEIESIKLFSSDGRELLIVDNINSLDKINIDVSNFSTGNYIIQLQLKHNSKISKAFIINK